jgi:serine phosphatase RsbU (regulator of sigma subunit)
MQIASEAFRRAQLRSERTRIVGFLLALSALGAIVVARTLITGAPEERELLPPVLLLVGALLAYEAALLAAVNRHIAAERELPRWLWPVNLAVEVLAPTVALFLLTGTQVLGPYRTLVAPVVLAFPMLIILSTLRLDPRLCGLIGILSGAGYSIAVAYTFSRYPKPPDAFDLPIYVTFALLLVLMGLLAGGVTVEIRKHVLASLKEAETRHELEQVRHDLDTARSIQQGLLPDEPPVAALFDIAGWNRPADATGGDYFDWQDLPGGRLAISLADVSGHGIGPALLMAVCRAYARATSPNAANATELLARLNQLMVADVPKNRFATYVTARLDPAASKIELASAGHGPLFLYRAGTDDFQSLRAQGPPLGMFSASRYSTATELEMGPGDLLMLVTDGFFEWANPQGEQYGAERIESTIRAGRDLTAADLIARLYRNVLDFAGGTEQEDDLTAVVVKRRVE